jgi:2-iminobutanoate/2-iminopropanoate deaminase
MRNAINRPGITNPLPYSVAIETSGRLLFISGQGPVDLATGQQTQGGFEAEARLTLDNLRSAAAAAGTNLSRAVKVNVFLRDMDDFPSFNSIYTDYFPEPRPARTTIQSDLPGFAIEIDAILSLDD